MILVKESKKHLQKESIYLKVNVKFKVKVKEKFKEEVKEKFKVKVKEKFKEEVKEEVRNIELTRKKKRNCKIII